MRATYLANAGIVRGAVSIKIFVFFLDVCILGGGGEKNLYALNNRRWPEN